jgi:hypothetical protein
MSKNLRRQLASAFLLFAVLGAAPLLHAAPRRDGLAGLQERFASVVQRLRHLFAAPLDDVSLPKP